MNSLFEKISGEYNFSLEQKTQYLNFIKFLQTENEKYNLTRIFETEDILYYHLIDSLEIVKFNLLNNYNTIYDIGTGAGIPGIMLAIFYPLKTFYLNEVTEKKIHFLTSAIELLSLKNCFIVKNDFLTVMRKQEISVDVFIARASIPLNDIIKIYEYKFFANSVIIYWVGLSWKENTKHNLLMTRKNLIWHEYPYTIFHPAQDKQHIYLEVKKLTKKR
jgi:16S rRNA (guanine(527)-N(7))-methyltransferase RsmG